MSPIWYFCALARVFMNADKQRYTALLGETAENAAMHTKGRKRY